MTKRLTEIVILGLFVVLAILLYHSTGSYPKSVQGSTAVYVRFLAASLGLLCLIQVSLWFKARAKDGKKTLGIVVDPQRFWGLLICLVLYCIAFGPLGFYISSALFLPVTMYVLGSRKYVAIGLTTAGVLVFVYLVFWKLLEVPLPEATLF